MSEAWRLLNQTERQQIVKDISDHALYKYELGAAEYGDTFQGDPLTHLEEELLDALFYCHMERRRRQHERG